MNSRIRIGTLKDTAVSLSPEYVNKIFSRHRIGRAPSPDELASPQRKDMSRYGIGQLQFVLALLDDRHRIGPAQAAAPDASPEQSFPMQLGDEPGGDQRRCLRRSGSGKSGVAAKGIELSPTTGAPKKGIERKSRGRRGAVAGAGGDREGVGEQGRLRIQQGA